MLKLYSHAMKSAFLISLVGSKMTAVFTTLPGPNRMPSRLMTKTRPLAVSEPRISDGPRPPTTRLSATEELFGWLKRTLSLTPILKVIQLMTALPVDWLTTTAGPPWPEIVAAPPTTVPPSGPAEACVRPSASSGVVASSRLRKRGCIAASCYSREVRMKAKRALLRRTAANGSRSPDQAKSLCAPINGQVRQQRHPRSYPSPQRLIHRLNVPESGKKSNRGAAHGCALVANGIDNVH